MPFVCSSFQISLPAEPHRVRPQTFSDLVASPSLPERCHCSDPGILFNKNTASRWHPRDRDATNPSIGNTARVSTPSSMSAAWLRAWKLAWHLLPSWQTACLAQGIALQERSKRGREKEGLPPAPPPMPGSIQRHHCTSAYFVSFQSCWVGSPDLCQLCPLRYLCHWCWMEIHHKACVVYSSPMPGSHYRLLPVPKFDVLKPP